MRWKKRSNYDDGDRQPAVVVGWWSPVPVPAKAKDAQRTTMSSIRGYDTHGWMFTAANRSMADPMGAS